MSMRWAYALIPCILVWTRTWQAELVLLYLGEAPSSHDYSCPVSSSICKVRYTSRKEGPFRTLRAKLACFEIDPDKHLSLRYLHSNLFNSFSMNRTSVRRQLRSPRRIGATRSFPNTSRLHVGTHLRDRWELIKRMWRSTVCVQVLFTTSWI